MSGWLPWILGGTIAAAWYRAAHRPARGRLTADREAVLKATLEDTKDPLALRRLADAFDKEGLTSEATLLRKRAALKELPAATQEKRRQAFRDALTSTDAAAVRKIAAAFDGEGCTAVAAKLRTYALGLEAAQKAA